MIRLDHVILGVQDLDLAADRLRERYGLDSLEGGRHPGWGTANRIVPMGSNYIELLGAVDREEASHSFLGRRLLEQTQAGDRLIGWCVAPDSLEAAASRLGLAVSAGRRERPDGIVLSWQSAGLEAAMTQEFLPFFISWTVPRELHPGLAPARHRIRPLGLAWVELSGDPDRLAEWLGGEEAPVRWTQGPAGVHAAGIATEQGDIVLA